MAFFSKDRLRDFIILIAFSIAVISASLLIHKVEFTDVSQYISVAKAISGSGISYANIARGAVYALILSPISSSIVAMKLLSAILLIIIGTVLYLYTRNRSTLFLWFLSPITFYSSSFITPLVLSSLLLTLGYIFWKNYQKNSKLLSLLISGLLIGLASAVWEGMLIISVIFLIAFMFKSKLNEVIYFVAALLIGFSVSLLVNQVLFGFFAQSFLRIFGANFAILFFGTSYQSQGSLFFSITHYILFLVVVSPLFVLLYRAYKTKYQSELFFILLSFVFFLLNAQFRFMLLIAPITLVVLEKLTTKKEKFIGIIIGILVILAFIPEFNDNTDRLIAQDLQEIGKEFPNQTFFVGNNEMDTEARANTYNALYFGKDIEGFVSYYDYQLFLNNQTNYFEYKFFSNPKIKMEKKLYVDIYLKQNEDISFDNIHYLILDKGKEVPTNFIILKSYRAVNLCEEV